MISYHDFWGTPKLLDLYGLRSQQASQQSAVSKCTEQVHRCKILVHWYTKLVYIKEGKQGNGNYEWIQQWKFQMRGTIPSYKL